MSGLEGLHDKALVEDMRIPEGHSLFPDGGLYTITSFYDRAQFSSRTATGAWGVSYRRPGTDTPVRIGAFASTKVKHVFGYFGEDVDRDQVIATMVGARGGNLVPDTREDVVEREAQVVAIVELYAEHLADQERATRIVSGIGTAVVPEAA